ncbi:MAG: hypothetical protein J5379_06275 [Clostridiales bacterium]|nr:hypothetical protein [Clostridiales bacterium]
MKKNKHNKDDRSSENLMPSNENITDAKALSSAADPDMPAEAVPTGENLSETQAEQPSDWQGSPDVADEPSAEYAEDIDAVSDAGLATASDEDLSSLPEQEAWIPDEPAPMELGAHEVHTLINEEDPDAPIFTETSTKPSDATLNSKGKKVTWKPKMFLIAMGIIAILILIWSVISLGNLNERMTSPLTVGNRDVSNAEFSFMYHYVLLENGVDIFKENTEKMLQAPGENGFPTYRDYFLDITAKEIQTTYMLYDDALEHGYSITDDHRERAQAYVDWLKTKADAIHVDLDTYIKGTFGPYVTKSLILQILPKVYFAEDYAGHQKLQELKATPEQAEAAYQDSRNSYDLVSYRVLRMTFEAREENYVTTANIHAQKIVDEIDHDQSKFESVAAKYFSGEAQQRLLVPDSTLHKRVRFSEINEKDWKAWLFDTSRQPGDCEIFHDEYGFPIIFCFVERVRQEEPLRNVRFFYINLEDQETGRAGIPASEIIPLSQTIFDSITDEASMITLETTYADELMDGSMRTLQQTAIYPGNNPEDVDEWIFDPTRQRGDKIMFERDNQMLILFYVEASPNPEWYDRVNSFIRMDNYQQFVSGHLKDYSYTFHEEGLKYIEDIPS